MVFLARFAGASPESRNLINKLMNAFLAVFGLLTIPIGIVNLLGGIVSGIWLLFLGEWKALGIGIFSMLFATFFLGLVLAPSLLFSLPASRVMEKGKIILGIILGSPGAFYTVGIMISWCYAVFQVFLNMADDNSRVPMLIWSYGVATGPWGYMASKESGGASEFNPSMLHTFFISAGYLLMILMTLVFNARMESAILALCLVMGFSFIFQVVAISAITKDSRRNHFLNESA